MPRMLELIKEIDDLLYVEKETCLRKMNILKDCECFALKTKFRKKGKAKTTLWCYFFLMISTFLMLNVWIYPSIFGDNEKILKTHNDINKMNSNSKLLHEDIEKKVAK